MTLLTVLPRLRTNNLKGLGAALTLYRRELRHKKSVATVDACINIFTGQWKAMLVEGEAS